MNKPRIFLSPPEQEGRELQAVASVLESNWLAPLGPEVEAFEQELASFLQVPAVALLSCGTAAIHLALKALGVGVGDYVLCQSFTFSASANPILYCGAIPVFIDSEPQSWNLDPEALETALITLKGKGIQPKACIVVDLYGMPADYQKIKSLLSSYSVPLLQDAAEALGSTLENKPLGSQGTFGVLSFNGNKIITTSGGGALACPDQKSAEKIRFWATQARDPAPHYQHSEVGYNYRLSNILAAIGRVQFSGLARRVARRREIFALYQEELTKNSEISFLIEPSGSKANRWLTTINFASGEKTREKIRVMLEKENIESRPLWKPLHLQPVFKDYLYYGSTVAEKLFASGLCLPSGCAMSNETVKNICRLILETLA